MIIAVVVAFYFVICDAAFAGRVGSIFQIAGIDADEVDLFGLSESNDDT